MKKKAILYTILFCILLLGSISAITIYSGDTIYYDFTNEVDVIQSITWEVVNNTYNLTGLNITTNLTGAIMSIDPLFRPDNFTIIFTITGKNEKVEVPRGGGGGTRKVYVENKTIVEVDKYIDRIIYNETEIIDLNDRIKKLEDDINKKKKEIRILIGFLIIWILLLVFLVNYVLRIRKGKK